MGFFNKALDGVRRKENAALAKAGDNTLKKTKYAWLYNADAK